MSAPKARAASAGNDERGPRAARQAQNGESKGRPSLEKTAEVVQKLEASVEAGIEDNAAKEASGYHGPGGSKEKLTEKHIEGQSGF